MQIVVIGGGAAGFFAAINCKIHHPGSKVVIYEKSSKLLSKVKVSGGGRCNVTHSCFEISRLARFYPRGEKQLKKAFGQFNTAHTVNWFESRGVELKTEADMRMFPTTNNSQTIIDCLLKESKEKGVEINTNAPVVSLKKEKEDFLLTTKDQKIIRAHRVIVASGGHSKLESFNWLKDLGHQIEPPVPSLFTFNMPSEPVKKLMGVSVDPVTIRIQGTKLKTAGPLLITHWGMSGPAVLKLSAFGARLLHGMNYQGILQVNWTGPLNEQQVWGLITEQIGNFKKRKLNNKNPFGLPARLWLFLLEKSGADGQKSWAETGKKQLNRLVNTLVNDEYKMEGKTTFKEEFVTCGGVSLKDVDFNSMESKVCPGLFFAGEVLDIDGLTGGFNFQAAWTTGFIAGKMAGS